MKKGINMEFRKSAHHWPSISPKAKAFFITSILSLALLCISPAAPRAEQSQFTLKSGAELKADVLKRTEDRLVLDLGFQVLTVPTAEVESEGAPLASEGTLVAPSKSSDSSASPTPKARPKGSFRERVAKYEEAVVVGSNPGGFGAGFIIDKTGLLITNYHVIKGEKYNDVTLFLTKKNGKKEKKLFKKVEVVGFSSFMDCAMLKIADEDIEDLDLPMLDLARPETIKTGVSVYAIGNPGMGNKMLKHSVTQGILSSTTRNFNDLLYLQTTAAVNPGNSGGPLVNTDGEVVGLVTFRAIWGEGLAFALPAWYLRHFAQNVEAYTPAKDSKNTGYRYHDPSQ
jgi:serine protease Do